MSCSPSMELGASDVSVFGTQWAEDANVDAHTIYDHKKDRNGRQ